MKIFTLKNYLFVLCFTLFLCSNSFGQGPRAFDEISYLTKTSGVGIRSLSMGGAVISNINDYSSIFWNPGGLAFVKSSEIYASFSNFILPVTS